MLSEIYVAYAATFVLAFSLYPVLARKELKRLDYREFVLLFTIFNALGAGVVAFMLGSGFAFTPASLALLALLGLLNAFGFYATFYAYENERVSIILPVLTSQYPLIALFDSAIFAPGSFLSTLAVMPLLVIGILLVSRKKDLGKRRTPALRFIAAAALATVTWSVMWVSFKYYLNPAQPLGDYAALAAFSLLWAVVASAAFVIRTKKRTTFEGMERGSRYVLAPGLMNGIGTVFLSAALVMAPVETPIVAMVVTPLSIVLAMAFLKERVNGYELLGIMIIIAAVVLSTGIL